jgi:hypothetical protein
MKATCFFIFGLFTFSGYAQPGDFGLRKLNKRKYIVISADTQLTGTFLNRIVIGNNYRNEWTASIRVPVLNFTRDFKGLVIEKQGGGRQTHTLHLKESSGREWVLRSVKKFPEKVISQQLRGTIAEKLVVDGISASYPYSVLSVGALAKAAGVPYFPNTLVYIPDDPVLGTFSSKYKNTLAFLEFRSIDKNVKDKTFNTEEIINELSLSNSTKVDQLAVLKARLLDNYIMDFDRYESQWVWAQNDSGGNHWYYPIPKDRDQAFFKGKGLITKFISRNPGLGPLQGLKAKAKNIATFNYSARNFDRRFLTELNEQTWMHEVDKFLACMTDTTIEKAIKKQPSEIHAYHTNNIITTLKNKRAYFKEDMIQYYRFLSRKPSLSGSSLPEKFIVTVNENKTVLVQIEDEQGNATYERLFKPSETKEINLFGLQGNDLFVVTGKSSPIKIRLIGGPDEDTFTNASGNKVIVYDVNSEKNSITGKNFKNRISNNPLNNEYKQTYPVYNTSSLGISLQYSIDGGLFIGPRYKLVRTGFRKDPYASRHIIYATRSLKTSAWNLHYNGSFLKIADNTDFLINTDAQLPTVRTHFFGWGNNTSFDKTKGLDYYKIQYRLIDASFMLQRWLSPWVALQLGPVIQNFQVNVKDGSNKFFSTVYPMQPGAELYNNKWYAGAKIQLKIDTRNHQLIPTRGFYATVYSTQVFGLFKTSNQFNQAGAELGYYTDVLSKDHLIFATCIGGGSTFGDVGLLQAQYLGFKQNLRGYRFQRFAGRSRAYNNTELRLNFGETNFYLFKGSLGILAFHDIGRVWVKGEQSGTWHTGYGGGVWVAPFDKMVVSGSVSFSKEENALPIVSLGFQF